MKKGRTLLIAVASCLASAMAPRAAEKEWPPLPDKGFISGRAATVHDIDEGNAIFVAQSAGTPIGKPLQVTIPQYAYWTNESGARLPVIVVQAEKANGANIFGIRDMYGNDYVCTEPELTLLGTTRPN